jgi:hypothetical protein
MGPVVSVSLTWMHMEKTHVLVTNIAIAAHPQSSLPHGTAYSLYPD